VTIAKRPSTGTGYAQSISDLRKYQDVISEFRTRRPRSEARYRKNRLQRSRQFIAPRPNPRPRAATNQHTSDPFIKPMASQKMISPADKQLLKTTWSMVAPISDAAAGLFYDRLFTLDPSLQRMFANADMKEQRRKLMQALAAVINGIDNLGALVPTLETLGKNHVRYGVTDRHYDTVAPPCSGRWNRASRKHGRQRQSPPGPRPIPPSQP
jgi:hypothetical protein